MKMKDSRAINLKKNFLNKDEDNLADKNTKENARLNDELEEEKKSDKNSSSYVGSSMAKNSTALLGYNKINTLAIEQNCKMVKKYLPRILDEDLKKYLRMIGAILIVGPKWSGKTTTAERYAKSV